MTFVSYAQNFEDVLLWRALRTVGTGFYVDIGAAHPDTDSVTRAFYDRGWHGINVEPTDAAFLRLVAARPRDVNLHLAAGAEPGAATFYSVGGDAAGLSTLDPDAAARAAALGYPARETTVRIETLAAICRAHAPADIHFLKIDVEGAERDVLVGADFGTYRPWVVLVEATAPMSSEEVHAGWEPVLLAAGYRFVWFDGLNRFYVAEERHTALAPHFRTPPNVFDDFLRAADTEWTRRIEQAETRAATLQQRALSAESRTAVARDRAELAQLERAKAEAAHIRATQLAEQRQAEIDRLLQQRADLARETERLGAEIARLAAEVARLRPALDAAMRHADASAGRAEQAERAGLLAQEWVEAMRRSTSWRVTGPLRAIAGGRKGADGPPAPAPLAPEPPALLLPEPEPAGAAVPPEPPEPPAEVLAPVLAPGPLQAVHQFHSGSAAGDAITNAMLLTRRVLRGLGYDSRIFVEHRDASCGDEIHHIDDLPQHGRYALIVRHSMGHDALPRILALPVPKILIYHNITPPELLADPHMQRYAQKGRGQLAELLPAMAAALADSDYNALELHEAGFARVATCPLLFDVDAMRADAAVPARGPVFTVLFVGRIAPSKGQLELVQAYARFRTLYRGESRLVLVGRSSHGDPYLGQVYAAIRYHEMDTGAVEVTGHVTDARLRQHYAEADLYVSLSQHEGFGVPLVEAMAHGVPVLAWPAAAVPYTMGGAAEPLEDIVPESVAARMFDLASDPVARASIVERQRRSLDRFGLARPVATLVSALLLANVRPPPEAAGLAAQARFTIAGHVSGSYSLAEVNRALALRIEAARPGAVRLLAVEADVTATVTGIPPSQRDAVRTLLSRPAPATRPHVVISQHYPVWAPLQPGDLALALFFWEESRIPAETVAALGAGFRGVLAPSRVVAKALIDSGAEIPVRVIGHAPSLARFHALRASRDGTRPDVFTFLHVSSCFPRKGVDVLLDVYARTFRASDAVRLVIKGFANPHNTVASHIAALQAADPGAPRIELIDADVSGDAMLALYAGADAMVLPTRGEGFNLPAAEALAAGVPLIVTGYGGHMDFTRDAPPGAVRLLRYRLALSGSHLANPFSLWAEPDGADLADALREAVRQGRRTADPVPLGTEGFVDRLAGIATDLLLAPGPPAPTIAWVTTWDVRCGIAEYSRQLVGAIEHAGGGPVTILADMRTDAAAATIPSWQVHKPESLPGLLGTVLRHDPRIVVVQHQPGLLRWSTLATLLTAAALTDRVVCVALHNTHHLLETDPAERATVIAALGSISRVIVHTLADVNRLAELGLGDNVTLIPQGTPPPALDPAPTRLLRPDAPVLIGSYGFFLPGKGLPELIEALAILRVTWPLARLRLVNAEYPLPQSAEEIGRCRAIAAAAGLADAVEFETGFLEHAQSAALLQACDLIALPYRDTHEASSAAVRSALATLVPVAVSPIPLFDEAGDAVFRLPGLAPADIAQGLAAALADEDARAAAAARARAWLDARGWPAIGRQWLGLLRALSVSGVVAGRP